MAKLKEIIKYYKSCVSEETKNSAILNLTKENSQTVSLSKGYRLAEAFPASVEFPESTKELLELMLQANVDSRKSLIYATAFVNGNVNGKKVNSPILYAPCKIDRDSRGLSVALTSDTWCVNASILALIEDKTEEEVRLLMSHLPVISASREDIAEWLTEFEQYFETGLKVSNKYQIICTTMPKASAGMLNDFEQICGEDKEVLDYSNNALDCIEDVDSKGFYEEQAKAQVHGYVNQMSESQVRALDVAVSSRISAIIGAPGTGKSNTIEGIATHLIANGKTVLIASKMNEAVEVVRHKLCDEIGRVPFAVRTGTKEYRKELASLLDDIVDGKYTEQADELNTCYGGYNRADLIEAEARTMRYNLDLTSIEQLSKAVEKLESLKFRPTLDYFVSRIDLFSTKHKIKTLRQRTENFEVPIEKTYLDVYRKGVFYNKVTENMENLTKPHARKMLILMSRMLKSGKLTEEYAEYFKNLINWGIPCWLTTVNAVSESIPCIKNLFDYVIIDEASQCDIGSCIPLLFRAKSAIIVGDNKQLKYLSFMSADKNLCFAKNFNLTDTDLVKLDYTKNSMFDFAAYYADKAPTMLREHFRSSSVLFGFSNKKFYNNKISCNLAGSKESQLLTCNVARIPSNWVKDDKDGYSIVEQDNKYTRNFYEAKAVLETIKHFIAAEPDKTIGVLSPFRAQVDLLRDMIEHDIPLQDRAKHRILVGTAHAFQGNERDIMLNSWTVAKNTRRQSFTFINNPNLFNVSVTRATQQVVNFVSVPDVNMLPDGLLKEYLTYCNDSISGMGGSVTSEKPAYINVTALAKPLRGV